jgi:8-oxo-dGTP pyrophosphatase MutT (NUDIX family)
MKLYDTDEFRATKQWPYAIAAGCVVYRKIEEDIEILLLTRDYDHDYFSGGDTQKQSYHLPKGHLKFSETLEAAAVRETTEELGAEVRIQSYLGAIHHTFDHPKHQNTTDKEIHYFAAIWLNDIKKIDNEHDGRAWVSLADVEKMLGKPNPKEEDEIIRRFKRYLELTNAS